MSFCPKCESLLRAKKLPDGRRVFYCRQCNLIVDPEGEEGAEGRDAYVHTQTIEHHPRERVKVMDEEYYDKLVPKSVLSDFKCRRCGFTKCFLQSRQTRSADEGMTHFIICAKCGKMFRIGS